VAVVEAVEVWVEMGVQEPDGVTVAVKVAKGVAGV
jgi:hypothetical protein